MGGGTVVATTNLNNVGYTRDQIIIYKINSEYEQSEDNKTIVNPIDHCLGLQSPPPTILLL